MEVLKMAKTKKEEKAKMGRPEKEINKKQFEELCKIQCTQKEICSVLNTTDKTLVKWCKKTYDMTYSDAYKRFSEEGLSSLRRAQFNIAQKNAGMAIFLGKNYLGQKDQVEQKIEVDKKLDNLTAALKSAAEQKEEEE